MTSTSSDRAVRSTIQPSAAVVVVTGVESAPFGVREGRGTHLAGVETGGAFWGRTG